MADLKDVNGSFGTEDVDGGVSTPHRFSPEAMYLIRVDERVKLNARGDIVEVYKHTLLNSLYFRGILGKTAFKGIPPSDEAIFVDCDKKSLMNMIAYMEFGHPRDPLDKKFFGSLLDKFGIDRDTPTEQNPSDKICETIQLKKQAIEKTYRLFYDQFKADLLKQVQEKLAGNGPYKFAVVLLGGRDYSSRDNHTFIYPVELYRTIDAELGTEDLIKNFLKFVVPPGRALEIRNRRTLRGILKIKEGVAQFKIECEIVP